MQGSQDAVLLDRAHLDRQTFGDTDLAVDLLGLFAQQCRRLMPGILETAASLSERADLAHTLKGSALGIGADRIARLAGRTEDAFREGRAEEVSLHDLDRAVTDTLAALAAGP